MSVCVDPKVQSLKSNGQEVGEGTVNRYFKLY